MYPLADLGLELPAFVVGVLVHLLNDAVGLTAAGYQSYTQKNKNNMNRVCNLQRMSGPTTRKSLVFLR